MMDKTAEQIAEDERVEAERVAAEEAEAQRLEDERLEAERVAAEAELDPETGKPKAAVAEAEDETVVTIGDEESPTSEEELAKAPEWVKELRKNHRETQRQLREANDKLKAVSGAEHKAPEAVGEKPKLEDHDYDAEKFGAALEAWHERKRQADETARKQQDEEQAAKAAWQTKLDAYGQAKAKLKVKDADEAEAVAQEILATTQQGIILQGADNPALLIHALGKNPKKAKELAAIKDPVKFAFAVAKLETQLKVTTRKAPPPEEKVRGSAPITGAIDSQLARLRAEAEKTGDYSKVNEYRRSKRKAA